MDAQDTAGYSEACAQCSAVDWGVSDEGRFYCKTCHNVIERTQDVQDTSFTPGSSRISTFGTGRKSSRTECGREWMICEGFQFILRNQANALLRLGVGDYFKDHVLCEMWRLYLQKSRQAYTHKPVRISHYKLHTDSSSTEMSSRSFVTESDGETSGSNQVVSTDHSCIVSACSNSDEDVSHLSARRGRSQSLMSMSKTLGLVHLALVWSREALTLSDLLRLVNKGHVPYVNAYEQLPDEMNIKGKDALIFRVESVPSHTAIHREAETLLSFLQLPAFPPVTGQTLLHPVRLSLRYLIDSNLPVELHPLLCRLIERTGMMDPKLHTCGCSAHPAVPLYDVQTAALIIVTMKLLFGLNDQTEWDLSSQTIEHQHAGDQFSLRRWYRLLQGVLIRAQNRQKVDVMRKQWKGDKPLHLDKKDRRVVMKKKRTAQQLRVCYEKLSSQRAAVQHVSPCSFRFCWGDQYEADGPSFHQKKLGGILSLPLDTDTLRNSWYWHPALKRCKPRTCRSHYEEVEATLPQTFKWFLKLFCFLLDIKPACLYEEVLKVERRLFTNHT
eukprot:XP_011616932.1 PREDICTED: TATA box-binding protein-associated factor RNA polymerase I subunit B isoform X1 [Takifugu rubripes]